MLSSLRQEREGLRQERDEARAATERTNAHVEELELELIDVYQQSVELREARGEADRQASLLQDQLYATGGQSLSFVWFSARTSSVTL